LVQGNQSSEKNGNSNGFNYISVVMELGYPDLTHISIYIRQNQTFLVVFLQMHCHCILPSQNICLRLWKL